MDVKVNASREETVIFEAFLYSPEGEIIVQGNLVSELEVRMAGPVYHKKLIIGTQKLSIYFNGGSIQQSGISGPYIIVVEIPDGTDAKPERLEFTTSPYKAESFQSMLVESWSISDYGSDRDSDGLFDYLTVDLELEILARDKFSISGMLFVNDNQIGDGEIV